MDNLQKICIPTNLLGDIAARMSPPGRISPLWPFCQEKGDELRPLPGDVPGVTNANGELTAEAAAILGSVIEVMGFVRIIISVKEKFAEKLIYFPANGIPVLLSPGQKTFNFTAPAPIGDILAGLAEQIGISTESIGDFAVELSAAEALVLAAVIDLERRHVLSELAAGKMPEPIAVEAVAVEKVLSATTESGQWLVPLIANLVGKAEMESVETVFDALVKTGFLVDNGSRYLPADALWKIAERLPLTDRVCAVSAGREAKDAVILTGFTCIIGGAANFLYIETADGRVRFKTPSAREVLAEIEYLLTTPDALQPLADAVPVEPPPVKPLQTAINNEAAAPAGIVCKNCGALISPNSSFCQQCGKSAGEKKQTEASVPTFCRQCGKPVFSWAKYCTVCGTSIKS